MPDTLRSEGAQKFALSAAAKPNKTSYASLQENVELPTSPVGFVESATLVRNGLAFAALFTEDYSSSVLSVKLARGLQPWVRTA